MSVRGDAARMLEPHGSGFHGILGLSLEGEGGPTQVWRQITREAETRQVTWSTALGFGSPPPA